MTFSEKGLIRAMKAAYGSYGYTAAQSDSGLLIFTDSWGCGIREDIVPNAVKGLVVSHAGKLPADGRAMLVSKNVVGEEIYDVAVERVRHLKKAWNDGTGKRTCLTRLTMDGMAIWQRPEDLKMMLTDPEDMKVLEMTGMDAYEVAGAVYEESWNGIVWVQGAGREGRNVPLQHLEQMQFIAGVDE